MLINIVTDLVYTLLDPRVRSRTIVAAGPKGPG
jgi:hypothetical protein